eukprot:CAMPEP_0118669648 /NCGR_PEP_ID=MMETSP0785-20121206/21019_1 /TAXON_ID=91992 /ORGANISM="Bolidomonas pacifica, Strain CCMP 1866" /LENGTH=48 /DNA_ID= /DNA_START= /DNA_END= /DNA_ORIENTATION=
MTLTLYPLSVSELTGRMKESKEDIKAPVIISEAPEICRGENLVPRAKK